ncbi:MAG TPA: TIGR00730 family Rossman fold protein [Caulobacteraceae bacterium]|nr:TIGR00730 family Rossman fold protein [Caulobacteraceae bacterium]
MAARAAKLDSVCLYCGSSDAADPAFITDAQALGAMIARAGLRLIYGGGGVGLMGACARGAHEAGGKVLGVIPDFLRGRERPLQEVETIVVSDMHQRKMMMFEEADAFVVLPGGIGTLEEVVELLSWRRLDLHAKPVVFYNPRDFWSPLFELFDHTIRENLTPPEFNDGWRAVGRIEEVVPALRAMAAPPDALADKVTTRVA